MNPWTRDNSIHINVRMCTLSGLCCGRSPAAVVWCQTTISLRTMTAYRLTPLLKIWDVSYALKSEGLMCRIGGSRIRWVHFIFWLTLQLVILPNAGEIDIFWGSSCRTFMAAKIIIERKAFKNAVWLDLVIPLISAFCFISAANSIWADTTRVISLHELYNRFLQLDIKTTWSNNYRFKLCKNRKINQTIGI